MLENWICGRRKQRQNIRISSKAQKERTVIRFPLFQSVDCVVSSITEGNLEKQKKHDQTDFAIVVLLYIDFLISLLKINLSSLYRTKFGIS